MLGNITSLLGFIGTLPGISPQILNSLLAKVENAIAAYDSGNEIVAVNILNALLNEISAQTGKTITINAASALTAYIENLITYIQSN